MTGLLAAATGASVGVAATTFGFGFRHGLDWDHLSAISDITQSVSSRRRALGLSTLYALGHAAVVFVLGAAAIALGSRLPASVDRVMGRFVGATLVALGVFVLISIARHGRDFQMQSRWMLIIRTGRRLARLVSGRRNSPFSGAVARAPQVLVEHEHEHEPGQHHVHSEEAELATTGAANEPHRVVPSVEAAALHRHRHRHLLSMPDDPFLAYGTVSAVAIGMVHGIGAETPTQVLVLATAAGVAGTAGGLVVLSSFLAGLFCSNTFVALASTFGLRRARTTAVYLVVSVLIAVGSIGVGTLFLLGRDSALPAIFG